MPIIDPSDFEHGEDISNEVSGATLSLHDGPGASGQPPHWNSTAIYASDSELPAPGNKVFAFRVQDDNSLRPIFVFTCEALRVDFDGPVSSVDVAFITDDSSDPGRVEAYNSDDELIDTAQTTGAATLGGMEIATVNGSISYILCGGAGSSGSLINWVEY